MRIPFVIVAVLCLAGRAPALTVRALSLDELVARADRIVHARCLRVAPLATSGALPVVEITLGVEENVKGEGSAELVIHQLGGQWMRVLPTCRAGDEIVLFLHAPSRAGLTSPVGAEQGYLRVVREPGGTARVVGDARIVGALSRSAPSGSSAALHVGPRPSISAPLDEALGELRARVGRR